MDRFLAVVFLGTCVGVGVIGLKRRGHFWTWFLRTFLLAVLLGMLVEELGLVSPVIFAAWLFGTKVDTEAIAKAASRDGSSMKKCPACAELIKTEAKVCRFCQREQSPSKPEAA